MELIFLLPRIVYFFLIAPVWWVCGYLASFVFPYEGDSSHFVLTLVLATLVFGGLIAYCMI